MERNEVSVGYDAVYDAIPRSPTLRRLWSELAAGTDYPEAFMHISFVTLAELRDLATALHLFPRKTVVDLGCGRGGPALWVARETGAQLIGVDFSPVAVAQAAARAATLGLSDQTRFVVGTFDHTGLESHSADAGMSEDALQYAPNKRAAIVEAARILRPGARFVFTAFELDPDHAAGLPVIGTDPVDNYRPLLEDAGFSVDSYEEVPGWPEPMTRTYQALLNARDTLIEEMGARAATALFMELTLTLQRRPYRRRIRAHATRTP
jgi:SAM-dependent methyltransferase